MGSAKEILAAKANAPVAAPVTVFLSAREDITRAVGSAIEAEATYFSRRAMEERLASSAGLSRKSRQIHLELALAYEFRAHLLTQEICDTPESQLCAL